jgi:N-acetylglutamate synthase/N-acetylornithine aminotransferase
VFSVNIPLCILFSRVYVGGACEFFIVLYTDAAATAKAKLAAKAIFSSFVIIGSVYGEPMQQRILMVVYYKRCNVFWTLAFLKAPTE